MIETVAAPIILKAVDFIYNEGREILKKRRERKLSQKQEERGERSIPESTKIVTSNKPVAPESPDIIRTKEEILQLKVSEAALEAHEGDINHLLTLLEIQTRNYRLASEQYAKWGSTLVPPGIVHNLEESEDAIEDTMRKLQDSLNKLYGKTIVIPHLEEVHVQ